MSTATPPPPPTDRSGQRAPQGEGPRGYQFVYWGLPGWKTAKELSFLHGGR